MNHPSIADLSPRLVSRLMSHRASFEKNWKMAFLGLPKYHQREILFWSTQTGISCEAIVREAWKTCLADSATPGRVN